MTLAIGAKYPWGSLNRLFAPNAKPPNAIILVSDSRWTFRSRLYEFYLDVGAKLFKIDKHTGAVYAGVSEIGEACVDELREQLPKQKISGYQSRRELIQVVFRKAYKCYLASKRLKSDECPLCILVGGFDALGEAELCLFEFRDNFLAKPLESIHTIGMPKACTQFLSIFNTELNQQVEKELSLRRRLAKTPIAELLPMPINPHHIAIFITASLHTIIESGVEKRVGGKIQSAVITAEEFSLPKISYTTDPTNEGPGFTRVTPTSDELRTWTQIFGCYPPGD